MTRLVLALLLAILLAALILWLMQHREEEDMPPFLVLFLLGEFPLLIAAVLILTRKAESIARGAGLACVSALGYTVLTVPLFLDVAWNSSWDPEYHYLHSLKRFIPVSVAGAIFLVVSAFAERARSRKHFWRYFGGGVPYLIAAVLMLPHLSVRGSRYLKERANYWDLFKRTTPPVWQLTACLIRHQFLHPGGQYPNSLAEIAPDWNCNAAVSDPRSFSPYWIFYSRDRRADGGADFRLEAIPGERNHLVSDPMVSDARGEVIRFTGLGVIASERRRRYGPLFAVRTDDVSFEDGRFAILELRDKIHEFEQNHDSHLPASLPDFLDEKALAKFTCTNAPDPLKAQIGVKRDPPCYVISYSSVANNDSKAFTISLQCMNYGNGCIQSFFLDSDGNLHVTSEPRPATRHDFGLLPCEVAVPCKDPVWTTSRPPSEWMFFIAHIHYFVNSTNWWYSHD